MKSKITVFILALFVIGCTTPIQSDNTDKLLVQLNQKYTGKQVTHGTKTEIYNLLGDCHQKVHGQLRYHDFYFDNHNIKMTLRKAGYNLTYYKFEREYPKFEPK